MSTPIQSFSFKGAILIAGSVLLLNIGVIPLLVWAGVAQNVAAIFVNSVLSSGCIAYVSVFVDGNHDRKTFLKRYVLFGLLFGITTYLWSMNIFI